MYMIVPIVLAKISITVTKSLLQTPGYQQLTESASSCVLSIIPFPLVHIIVQWHGHLRSHWHQKICQRNKFTKKCTGLRSLLFQFLSKDINIADFIKIITRVKYRPLTHTIWSYIHKVSHFISDNPPQPFILKTASSWDTNNCNFLSQFMYVLFLFFCKKLNRY